MMVEALIFTGTFIVEILFDAWNALVAYHETEL